MILITGGAGYIGSHTCVELLQEGYEIVVVDNFTNSNPEVLNRISEISGKEFVFYKTDIRDKNKLEEIFANHPIESVIHFAGLKAVGESVEVPLKYYKTNIVGTTVLLETMQKFNVKNIVFSSSATVYGMPDRVPITEGFPLKATNPYGRTKLIIEEMLQDIHFSDPSWSITILRYFNPIGAHESGKIGEEPKGVPNNLFPYITKVAVGELEELLVFGNHYPTIDGTGVRDYIHVVDLAKAHVAAIVNNVTSLNVDIYNVGTGKGYSVLEVINAFELITGINVPYKIVNPRQGDVAICYADVSKAKKELGFSATRSMYDMCKDGWQWQSNQKNIKVK